MLLLRRVLISFENVVLSELELQIISTLELVLKCFLGTFDVIIILCNYDIWNEINWFLRLLDKWWYVFGILIIYRLLKLE